MRETAAELALIDNSDPCPLRYAHALSGCADAGGYDMEVTWEVVTTAGLRLPYDRARSGPRQHCPVASRRGRSSIEYRLALILSTWQPDSDIDIDIATTSSILTGSSK